MGHKRGGRHARSAKPSERRAHATLERCEQGALPSPPATYSWGTRVRWPTLPSSRCRGRCQSAPSRMARQTPVFVSAGRQPQGGGSVSASISDLSYAILKGFSLFKGTLVARQVHATAQHDNGSMQVRPSCCPAQTTIAHLARRQHLGQVVQPHAASAKAGPKVDKAHVADRRQRQLLTVPVLRIQVREERVSSLCFDTVVAVAAVRGLST